MNKSTYEELLVFANEKIKQEYESISEFARSAKILKSDGETYYTPSNISNLLSIPKGTEEKKVKSFHFLNEIYKLWGYELQQEIKRVTKVTISINKELVL